MNFNYSKTAEYSLFKEQTQEVINLYGVQVKYIITKKVNPDYIFGEHNSIKVDNENIYDFYILPDTTEDWMSQGDLFGKFGLQNNDSLEAFIGVSDIEYIHPSIVDRTGKGFDGILGNLIILPNNKIMEITNFETDVQGRNNLFTYDAQKNVYKITLKQYIANSDDYSKADDITQSEEFDYQDFGNLEQIFNKDETDSEEIESASTEIKDEVVYPNEPRKRPIRDKEAENNPFGTLG